MMHHPILKSIDEDLISYKMCIILKTSIISPRRRLYANERSLSEFNLYKLRFSYLVILSLLLFGRFLLQ